MNFEKCQIVSFIYENGQEVPMGVSLNQGVSETFISLMAQEVLTWGPSSKAKPVLGRGERAHTASYPLFPDGFCKSSPLDCGTAKTLRGTPEFQKYIKEIYELEQVLEEKKSLLREKNPTLYDLFQQFGIN